MRILKNRTAYVIQGNYVSHGSSHGWEDENEEATLTEGKRSLREYRANGPGQYRMIIRRIPIVLR